MNWSETIWGILCDRDGQFRYSDDNGLPIAYNLNDANKWGTAEREDIKEAARRKFGQLYLKEARKNSLGVDQAGAYDTTEDTPIAERINKELEKGSVITTRKYGQELVSHIENGRRWPKNRTELNAIEKVYGLEKRQRDVFYLLAIPPEPAQQHLDLIERMLRRISGRNQRGEFKTVQEDVQDLRSWLLTMLTPFDPVDNVSRKKLDVLLDQTNCVLELVEKGLAEASQAKSMTS